MVEVILSVNDRAATFFGKLNGTVPTVSEVMTDQVIAAGRRRRMKKVFAPPRVVPKTHPLLSG